MAKKSVLDKKIGAHSKKGNKELIIYLKEDPDGLKMRRILDFHLSKETNESTKDLIDSFVKIFGPNVSTLVLNLLKVQDKEYRKKVLETLDAKVKTFLDELFFIYGPSAYRSFLKHEKGSEWVFLNTNYKKGEPKKNARGIFVTRVVRGDGAPFIFTSHPGNFLKMATHILSAIDEEKSVKISDFKKEIGDFKEMYKKVLKSTKK